MRWDEIPQLTACRNSGADWSLFRDFCNFIEREEAEGLILNPDFQRGHIWTEEQQTAYIEYLLMRAVRPDNLSERQKHRGPVL